MKSRRPVNEVEKQIAHILSEHLSRVPFVQIESIKMDQEIRSPIHSLGRIADVLINIRIMERNFFIICEVKNFGYPSSVQIAIDKLQTYINLDKITPTPITYIPIIGASWLSPQSRSLCENAGMGWVDLAGNCRIAFDGIYIEREIAGQPKSEARNFRAVFSPKATQVLRTLLRDPGRTWKVADLAKASGVSLGHASNVGAALRDRQWAATENGGLRLTAPDELLDAWRDNYQPVPGKRSSWYSILHGRQMDEALRKALSGSDRAMLGGLSAAHWLAPYVRGNTTMLYADPAVMPHLVDGLKLKPVKSGANVEIIEPDDPMIFQECTEIDGSPPVSSPILTYLDLSCLKDRGQEAADHLRQKFFQWQ